MLLLAPHLPTFAVAAVYLVWSAYHRSLRRRHVLCQRVAFMLWTAAQPMYDESVAVD